MSKGKLFLNVPANYQLLKNINIMKGTFWLTDLAVLSFYVNITVSVVHQERYVHLCVIYWYQEQKKCLGSAAFAVTK